MNHHVNPPGASQDASLYLPTNLTPEQLFQALGRLRSEAAAEIERLLQFLDDLGGDPDLEPAGDELDASYPEGGARMFGHPNEDDEDGADSEPMLGTLEPVTAADGFMRPKWDQKSLDQSRPQGGMGEADPEADDGDREPALAARECHPSVPWLGCGRLGGGLYFDVTGSQLAWAAGDDTDREGDGCADDREPDVDDEEDDPAEPSLGWTDDEAARGRVYAGSMGNCADLEEQCGEAVL